MHWTYSPKMHMVSTLTRKYRLIERLAASWFPAPANAPAAMLHRLPVRTQPQRIAYSVTEEPITGYTSEITGDMDNGFTAKNTHRPEETSVTVKKVWDDNGDQDGKRGGVVATVTLRKTVNGETTDVETVEVGKTDDWSKTWTGLAKYEGGKAIT